MKKTTRTAAIASALTAGIAGLALSAPMAMAAPTATPTTTSTPRVTPTSTPTATKTPSNAPVGPLRVSATAPGSLTSPVVVTVSGATSTGVSASIGEPGTDKVISSGSAKVSDAHTARIVLPAPKNGWIPGLDHEVVVRVNGQTVTKNFTTPAGDPKGTGTLTPPSRSTDPAVVSMRGLKPGAKISALAGPYATDDIQTRASGTVREDGTVTLRLPAPKAGWKNGVKYGVVVGEAGNNFYQASFTFHGGNSTGNGGGTSGGTSAKDTSGGLAKTGR